MAKRYSTATVKSDGTIVPWLAAHGPLAYFPEDPPNSKYFFQYGWLMPRVYGDRRHYYFGDFSSWGRKHVDWDIRPLVDFWSQARTGAVVPTYVMTGRRYADGFMAPIACYRYRSRWDGRDIYLLIQHGSYLTIDVAEQPHIHDGQLILFRGVGRKRSFSWPTLEGRTADQSATLRRYFDAHQTAFSDAEVSFQVAHARVRRCETSFLRWELSWADVAKQAGFDAEGGSLERRLASMYQQSFTLVQRTAAWKFGPNYVKATTPMNNVRITSFFAGESEVNVIDPRRVEVLTLRLSKSTFACVQRGTSPAPLSLSTIGDTANGDKVPASRNFTKFRKGQRMAVLRKRRKAQSC